MKQKTIIALLMIIFLILAASANESINPIVIYGDSRSGHHSHRMVISAIRSTDPKVVFHTGDLVSTASNLKEWETFNQITAKLREKARFYSALGNHDYDGRDASVFFENFDLPNNERWYYIDLGNTRFIVLDSTDDLSSKTKQYQWLESVLENKDNKIKFTIAIFHHYPFRTSYHKGNNNVAKNLLPLFKQYKISASFCGHSHLYQRAIYEKTYYIATGGGGAPLHALGKGNPYQEVTISKHHFCKLEIGQDEIKVEVLDTNNQVLDSFSIK